jgi:hypothetical protein
VVVEGIIEVQEGSLFEEYGLNASMLSTSGTTVTGAAYWRVQGQGVQADTPVQVQSGSEGNGNQLMVLGAWGDARVAFDGT